jgi:hypothetical protein
MDLNYFAVTHAIEDFGSIGGFVKVLSVGEIVKTTTTASTIDGTGEIFEPTMTVLGVSYSRILTDRVTFGITAKFISESIDRASANGMAFDFGVNYDTKWSGLRLGFVLKNIGPNMKFTGSGFEYQVNAPGQNDVVSPDKTFAAQSSEFELPSWYTISGVMDVYSATKNRVSLYGTFESNNFSRDMYRFGVEYGFDNAYFLRAGYTEDDRQTDYLYGFTFGAGVMVKFGETDVTFEYSWTETEFFDNNQYFTGKINF